MHMRADGRDDPTALRRPADDAGWRRDAAGDVPGVGTPRCNNAAAIAARANPEQSPAIEAAAKPKPQNNFPHLGLFHGAASSTALFTLKYCYGTIVPNTLVRFFVTLVLVIVMKLSSALR